MRRNDNNEERQHQQNLVLCHNRRYAQACTQQPHGRNQQPADKHAHAEKAKGQKETRDTSDIAYLRMRRMHRAFISTLD